jgi:hypothetical protein
MHDPAHAFLVALDISGFSNDVDPDQLSNHRMNFFHSVESTRLFPEAKDQGTVKVHFLGDELRLAFLVGVGGPAVKEFVDDVFAGLDRVNRRIPEPQQTRIKGVVLEGEVTWKSWRGCVFLNGDLPIQSQNWMRRLKPDEVAVNAKFRLSLQTEGTPIDFTERDFSGETGYMLRP